MKKTTLFIAISLLIVLVLVGASCGEEEKRKKKREEKEDSIEDGSSGQKDVDNDIKANMAILRTVAELIYADEDSYANFNCKHKDAKLACDEIEELAGRKPYIYTSKNEYCAYVQMPAKQGSFIKYCCIDSLGNLNETTALPEQRGYCDRTTFLCPG